MREPSPEFKQAARKAARKLLNDARLILLDLEPTETDAYVNMAICALDQQIMQADEP